MYFSTRLALVALDCKVWESPFAANGKIVYVAIDHTISYDFRAAAMRAGYFLYRNTFEF